MIHLKSYLIALNWKPRKVHQYSDELNSFVLKAEKLTGQIKYNKILNKKLNNNDDKLGND